MDLAPQHRGVRRVEFRPRALVDVSKIDMSTTLFGQKIDWPFFCSPTALQRLFNYEGEGATARAAHASGTIFSLSSISSIEHRGRREIYRRARRSSRSTCSRTGA